MASGLQTSTSTRGRSRTAAEARVVPSNPRSPTRATERRVTPGKSAAPVSVDRTAVNHAVTIGGVDVSKFVTKVSVGEQVDKAADIKITLDNTEFEVGEWAVLRGGSVMRVKLFDGQKWRSFGEVVVSRPERQYGTGGSIELKGLSREITLQLNEKSKKWEGKRHSEIVADLAKLAGLSAAVEQTEPVHKEVTMADESISSFLNRLATRDGYEWGVEGTTLFYRKPAAKDTGVVLKYRPSNGMGTIISAKATFDEAKKQGASDKRTPKAGAVDVDAGTIDPATMAAVGKDSNPAGTPADPKAVPVPADATQKEATYKISGGNLAATQRSEFVTLPQAEVKHPEVARTADEADKLKKNLARTNVYDKKLSLTTYGMVDLKPRIIITVEGLNSPDNGKWIVDKVEHDYSASGYRMNLGCKASVKPNPTKAAKTGDKASSGTAAQAQLPTERTPTFRIQSGNLGVTGR